VAQFDVYINPSKASKKAYPFILNIQSSLIDNIATRIVVPLALYRKFKNEEIKGLTPKVSFKNRDLLILIPQLTSMPSKSLKNPVGTLSHLRDEIISALDLAITGI
jgi:toxin CcdB